MTENQTTPESKFDQWAVLELFGHKRLAGRVQETQIAGGNFLRVDVPHGPNDSEPYTTRFYNPSAIYSISPVTEAVARAVASRIHEPPVTAWDLGQRQLRAGGLDGDTDD